MQTAITDITVSNGNIVKIRGALSEWTNKKKEIIKSITVEKGADLKPLIKLANIKEYTMADIVPSVPIDLEATYNYF